MSADRFVDEVAANRANWDARAVVHEKSAAYDIERYLDDPAAISSVVDWDRRQLGDVAGLDLLHLQCHIGTDSLSWSRLGANVTGLDFSPASLAVARDLAARAQAQVEFVRADVRDAERVLGRRFDLVYTSVGVLCWIPDVRAWARAAAACVRPGGRLYIRDGHPLLSALALDRADGQVVCTGDYFGDGTPQRYESEFSYTGDQTPISSPLAFEWAHSLSSIIMALIENGLVIRRVDELDWLDWRPYPWMVPGEGGRWRFPPGQPRLPLQFSILAVRPGGDASS